jgi:asparagine N-glycosylation enzyme membrane subunit Stt3
MSHTPLAHAASPVPTDRSGLSWSALALAALVAAVFPVAMLALAFPVVVGFLALGLGGLAIAGAGASR